MQILGKLQLTSAPDTLSLAQSWLETIGDAQHWPPRLTFILTLCLDEALTNILTHGFAYLPDGAPLNSPAIILLELYCDDLTLTLKIADNGRPFDPTQATPTALQTQLDETVIGGHGLRLMRHYLHEIRYQFYDGFNHLQMIIAQDMKHPDEGTT